jgi:outer membrane immunogenic protein
MHRTAFAAGFALVASTTIVFAGGVGEQAAPPAMVPVAPVAASTEFAGAYVGLAYGNVGGDGTGILNTINIGPVPFDIDIDSDETFGFFGGYNVQRGNLVYGGELAAWAVDANTFGSWELASLIDIRGRVGFVAGDALFYGAAGWSWGTHENTITGVEIGLDGHSLGLGVEYNVTDQLFVGVDYTMRSMDGANADLGLDLNVNTLALRGGFRF